jgi:hypothetical protein
LSPFFSPFVPCINSRITATTDAAIEKNKIIQDHARTKLEAAERRRSRRLRRQLEETSAGDTVMGHVVKVLPEGVLVNVLTVGALDVVGMLRTKDLPEELQIPAGMNEKYQLQLLTQDFPPGKEVVCSVAAVVPNPTTAMQYVLELHFERFGAPTEEEYSLAGNAGSSSSSSKQSGGVLVDKFDTMTAQEKRDVVARIDKQFGNIDVEDEEESASDAYNENYRTELEDDEEEDADYDDTSELKDSDGKDALMTDDMFEEEVQDIYDELLSKSFDEPSKSKKRRSLMLPVQSFYDWDAVMDMIDDDELSLKDVDEAMKSVGVKLKKGSVDMTDSLSVPQFRDAIEILQEKSAKTTATSSSSSSSSDQHIPTSSSSSPPVTPAAPSAPPPPLVTAVAQTAPPSDMSKQQQELQDSLSKVMLDLYTELRGESPTLSADQICAWEYMENILKENLLTRQTIDRLVTQVQAEYSAAAANTNNALAADAVTLQPAGETSHIPQAELGLTFEQFSQLLDTVDDILDEKSDEVIPDFPNTVSFGAVAAGPQSVGALAGFANGDGGINTVVSSSSVKAKSQSAAHMLRSANDGNAGDEEFREGEDEEALREIFDELKSPNGRLLASTFKSWDTVQRMISAGEIEAATVDLMIHSVCCNDDDHANQLSASSSIVDTPPASALASPEKAKKEGKKQQPPPLSGSAGGAQVGMNCEQFVTLVRLLDEVAALQEGDEIALTGLGKTVDPAFYKEGIRRSVDVAAASSPEDATIVASAADKVTEQEQQEDMAAELFRNMRDNGSKGAVHVRDVIAWEEVQELLQEGYLHKRDIKSMVESMGLTMKSELTFEQFRGLLDMIDEATAGEEEEENHSALEENVGEHGGEGYSAVSSASKTQHEMEARVRAHEAEEEVEGQEGVFGNNADADTDFEEEYEDENEDNLDEEQQRQEYLEMFEALQQQSKSTSTGKISKSKKGGEDVKDGKVSVKDVLALQEIQELVAAGYIDSAALKVLVEEVGCTLRGKLDFEQFCDFLALVDETTADFTAYDDEVEEDEEEDEDPENAQVVVTSASENAKEGSNAHEKGKSNHNQLSARTVATSVDEREQGNDDDYGDDDDSDENDEVLTRMATQLYQELLPKGKKQLPVKKLLAWPGIQDEVTAGNLLSSEVTDVILAVLQDQQDEWKEGENGENFELLQQEPFKGFSGKSHSARDSTLVSTTASTKQLAKATLTLDQFMLVMDSLEEIIGNREEQQEVASVALLDEHSLSGVSSSTASGGKSGSKATTTPATAVRKTAAGPAVSASKVAIPASGNNVVLPGTGFGGSSDNLSDKETKMSRKNGVKGKEQAREEGGKMTVAQRAEEAIRELTADLYDSLRGKVSKPLLYLNFILLFALFCFFLLGILCVLVVQ